ncbi:MAG: DNA-methyltransferase [Promethearchaeota archaeon]
MSDLQSNSIDLMITSPPYPMIEMWDSLFASFNDDIKQALEEEDGRFAFNLMHKELDKVWREVARVLKFGGIACVNIGDATRSIGKNFQLYPNHGRVSACFQSNNFIELPYILWRKPTNSPNKFLGSGMLPPNAYVTLEHEYILIFRKGNIKRKLPPKLENRYNSAFFWEERNHWFSDVWDDIKGISQNLVNNIDDQNQVRKRSAAFPLELAYRLINMFSLYEDVILDPFWGTGTTTLAAMLSTRSSIGFELNSGFMDVFRGNLNKLKELNIEIIRSRLNQHLNFIREYMKKGKDIKYKSSYYDFPVITQQERDILFYTINDYRERCNRFTLEHKQFELEMKNKIR